MKISKLRGYLFSVVHGLIFLLALFTRWYEVLGISLFTVIVIEALDRLGKGIVLREMIAMFACFITVIMPMVGYHIYTHDNYLARLWVRYMPVPEHVYFDYALPAMAGFTLALCFPIVGRKVSDQGYVMQNTLQSIRMQLANMPRAGIVLVLTGVIIFSFITLLPVPLQFVATLLYFGSFAGLLYVYFTPNLKFKRAILLLFIGFIVMNALRAGMFTVVAYMGITLFSFFFLGRRAPFWKKLFFFFIGAFFLLLVQSVKQTYRNLTWAQNYQGNKASLFTRLIWEKLNSSESFIADDAFFPIYYRANQGFNVSLVMRRFPAQVPYDNGKNLARSFAASLVPRLFWPDKPEAGGKYNMKYYAGIQLRGWSTNVGPLGEAYGAFGPSGGIIYMICLGAFIRLAYRQVFVVAKRIPLIVCWIPILFYQITYSAESDTLQILNSLFKAAFFIWMLTKVIPGWFAIGRRKMSATSHHFRQSRSIRLQKES